LQLSDYQGKYVILYFGGIMGRSLAAPQLDSLYEKVKNDERFVIIWLILENSPREIQSSSKYIFSMRLPWKQPWLLGWGGDPDLMSGIVRDYGLVDFYSVPALLLIGPDGKVLLSRPSASELAKRIDELQK